MSADLWHRPMCDCGHDTAQHAMGASFSPYATAPCMVKDCDCSDFRMVGPDQAEPKDAAA
jgi:hypothetical protein